MKDLQGQELNIDKFVAIMEEKGYTRSEVEAIVNDEFARIKALRDAGNTQDADSETLKFFEEENTVEHYFIDQHTKYPAKNGAVVSTDPYSAAGITATQTSMTSTRTTTTKKYELPPLEQSQREAIDTYLSKENIEARVRATESTSVEKILIANEVPQKLLVNSKGKVMQGIVKVKEDKLKEYEEGLVDTPENRAAFEALKKAWAEKTPVDVYVKENAHTPLGLIASVVNETGKASSVIMNKAEILSYLISDSIGQFGTAPGVKLKDVMAKVDNEEVSNAVATLGFKWVGKTQAIEEGHYLPVYVPMTPEEAQAAGYEKNVEKKTLRTKQSFKILTEDNKEREVRLGCEVETYPIRRLADAYEGKFKVITNKNRLSTPKDAMSINESVQQLMLATAALAVGQVNNSKELLANDKLANAISAIKQSGGSATDLNGGF